MSRALLIDAGNSRVKWAFAETAAPHARTAHAEPNATRTIASGVFDHGDEAAQRARLASLGRPARAVISNVAGPDAAARIRTLIEQTWPGLDCVWVRPRDRQAGVTNGYLDPTELGADRWCGMIGAHAAYPGEHLLIATLGTATTFEAVRADGLFAGGLIAPGWTLMMNALGQRTAQLPTLDAEDATKLIRSMDAAEHHRGAFACDTRTSLSEGCRAAQTALIEYAWREARILFDGDVRCIVGGGAADAVGAALRVPFTRHDGLVLEGLLWIACEAASADAESGDREPR
ncbi:type III pantothenate kinase [Pararobbsia silviterrae]|uniref:Type III pantothenate kinase n=1 Tax=Pararobbsia silviterrae TaxID=1792498 RepID=A0A494Y7U8_9BURK|nr:type III pantothenate kinase [Pararobbsia silviterrae]RKP58762.1 type III pantothenate kinase [Pararobbsia silviterrae]